MQGVFVAGIQIASVNAAKTLLYLTAPSNQSVEILGISVTETNVTAAEQLEFQLARISTLGTPTATTITPKPTEGTGTANSTVKGNVTASEPTYETNWTDRQAVANVGGYYYDPLPETKTVIRNSDTWGVKLLSSPTNTYTLDCQITFREVG